MPLAAESPTLLGVAKNSMPRYSTRSFSGNPSCAWAGGGVTWNGSPFETVVIPAKLVHADAGTGIQAVGGAFPMARGVDSRFRGNDGIWEHTCLANDTSSRGRGVWYPDSGVVHLQQAQALGGRRGAG